MIDITSQYPELMTTTRKDTADFFRGAHGWTGKDTVIEPMTPVPSYSHPTEFKDALKYHIQVSYRLATPETGLQFKMQ
jgi:hypothetical protein